MNTAQGQMISQIAQVVDVIPITGKTVEEARYGRDEAGYDVIEIKFTDGTVFFAGEMSQTRELAVFTEKPK